MNILSLHTPEIECYSQYTYKNKLYYCIDKGFKLSYEFHKLDDRPPSWSKIMMLLKYQYDWALWVDADCWILKDYDLSLLTDDAYDFVISKREDSLNLGVFFVKRSAYAMAVLEMVNKMTEFYNHSWWEQRAFIELYNNNKELQTRTKIISSTIINCPENLVTDETVIVHLAGCSDAFRTDYFKQLAEK